MYDKSVLDKNKNVKDRECSCQGTPLIDKEISEQISEVRE